MKQRREDIPDFARYFLEQLAATFGRPVPGLSRDAETQLQAYDWPGNVRQLRNAMERTLILAGEAEEIGPEALPPEITGVLGEARQAARVGDTLTLQLREAREQFERDYLSAQVERFGGNISRTAAFVGMERSALHRKLKSLGIQFSG